MSKHTHTLTHIYLKKKNQQKKKCHATIHFKFLTFFFILFFYTKRKRNIIYQRFVHVLISFMFFMKQTTTDKRTR